jgi:DNA-binding CsgD family transcriptional regulator
VIAYIDNCYKKAETTKIMQNYQREKNRGSNQNLAWRVNILEQSLSQLGQGIILLSKLGHVLYVTDLAQEAIAQNDGISVQDDKLVAVIEQDNARLQEMLELTNSEALDPSTYKNLYIHRQDDVKPYLLLISKMQFDADDSNQSVEGILILIKDTHANTIYWQERLKCKYALTKREAHFAVLLTEGRNVKEISTVMDISEETARQYLKACHKKMGVQKQHELVCLALDSARKR